ncbi:MAG: hypothetical protein R2881_03375 [Eubacteriales bacterium]
MAGVLRAHMTVVWCSKREPTWGRYRGRRPTAGKSLSIPTGWSTISVSTGGDTLMRQPALERQRAGSAAPMCSS